MSPVEIGIGRGVSKECVFVVVTWRLVVGTGDVQRVCICVAPVVIGSDEE